MRRYYKENITVLCLAVAIMAITIVFLDSGHILRSGGGFGLAAILVAKGVSRLRCHLSDIALSAVVLGLLLCSKMVSPSIVTPIFFEVAAIALSMLFAATGLTFKAIAADQKAYRHFN